MGRWDTEAQRCGVTHLPNKWQSGCFKFILCPDAGSSAGWVELVGAGLGAGKGFGEQAHI